MCVCGMGLDLSQVHNSDRDLGIVLSGQRNMILGYGKKKNGTFPAPPPFIYLSKLRASLASKLITCGTISRTVRSDMLLVI